jgi:hypothetical protein
MATAGGVGSPLADLTYTLEASGHPSLGGYGTVPGAADAATAAEGR